MTEEQKAARKAEIEKTLHVSVEALEKLIDLAKWADTNGDTFLAAQLQIAGMASSLSDEAKCELIKQQHAFVNWMVRNHTEGGMKQIIDAILKGFTDYAPKTRAAEEAPVGAN